MLALVLVVLGLARRAVGFVGGWVKGVGEGAGWFCTAGIDAIG